MNHYKPKTVISSKMIRRSQQNVIFEVMDQIMCLFLSLCKKNRGRGQAKNEQHKS